MNQKIAIIGGTGMEGFGLALRWTQSGEHIIIGSRNRERAETAAEQVKAQVPGATVEGALNPDAARQAKVVVLTVPLTAQVATVKAIREALQPGSILVDTTVPLEKSIGGRLSRMVQLWDGSAAEQAARFVGNDVHVVSAFHSLGAESLRNLGQPVESDVLIAGDDREARSAIASLVEKIPGARPVDLGPLDSSRYAEQMAALLITLNLRHKVSSSGVRFTGLPGLGGE